MSKKELPYKNKGDLTTGPIHKHLIRLTIPMIWGIFAVIAVQIVDTYYIGLLGTTELAGVSFTFPITMIISHFVFGINISMSSVVSRLIGQKKMEDVRRVVLHGIVMAFLASAGICGLSYLFLDQIFTALGAGPETMAVIKDYMPIWFIASMILSIPVNGNSAIRAAGDSVTPAAIMTLGAVMNLILDPIFIFGFLGVPAFGVKGAAIATAIAYSCSLVGGLYMLIVKKNLICTTDLHLGKFTDSFKRLIVIALPAGITNIIAPGTNAVITALLAVHGAEAVAAFGIVSRVESFALLIVISLGLGMSPIIGQNWGAEKFDRVHKTINEAIGFNFLWSFFIAAVFGLFAESIAGIFTDNERIIDIAKLFFYIVPFSYAFGNLVFGWSSAFNAMGMPQRSFVMIVVKSVVLTVPAIILGNMLYGITGLFVAIAAVNLISGGFFHWLSWRACHKCERERVLAEAAANA